jgi:hypothetical protein
MKAGEPDSFDASFASTSSGQHGKTRRTVAAVKPGAVAVQTGEPDSFDASFGSTSSGQHGKTKRVVAAVKPGAVSVKAGEPDSFDASFASSSSKSGQHGKTRRTVAAVQPGAVSVNTGEPDSFNASVGEKSSASRQHGKSKRTVAAVAPGAVAMKGDDEPDSFHSSIESVNEQPSSSRQHGKSKRTVAAAMPGAVAMKGDEEPDSFHSSIASVNEKSSGSSRQHGKSKRLVAAAQPGAVTMKGDDEPDSLNDSSASVNKKSSSSRRHEKLKRMVAATRPGAVAAKDGEEQDSFHATPGSTPSQFGKVKRTTAASVPGAVLMSQQEPDSFSMSGSMVFDGDASMNTSDHPLERSSRKNRDKDANTRGKSQRKTGAVTAGAVAVTGDDETDAKAKYGGRSTRSMTSASQPGVESLTGSEARAAEETRRRKDPRSSARETAAAAAAVAAAGTIGIAATGGADEDSNEVYRQRMNAKIEQMEADMSQTELNPAKDSDDDEFVEKSEPFSLPVVYEDVDKELGEDATRAVQTENVAAHGSTRPPEVEYGQVAGGDTGLAVAMAIDEDEVDPMLPSAIEYDPDAKPPLYRNRRFRLYAFVGVVVFIAVVAAVVAAVVTQNDSGSQDPTPAPTTLLESLYRQQFVNEVGEQVNVVGSPYDRAADWIMFEDPVRLPPDAPNLIQRYQLVLFYFLTTNNGEKRWNSCNPPLPNETDTVSFKTLSLPIRLLSTQSIKTSLDRLVGWLGRTNANGSARFVIQLRIS